MNAPDAAAPERTTLYDRRHTRRQRAKALSHIVPALVLLTTALAAVSGAEPLTAVTILELVVGAGYILLLLREMRHLKHHPHHTERVAWLEIAGAGILALEGYHILHRHHAADLLRGTHTFHILPYLYFLIAGFYLFLAFNLYRITQRRHLHLHAEGFGGRLGLLSREFHFSWAEVAAVEPSGAAELIVHRTDGTRQQISFAHLHDGPAHRDRLVAHAQQLHQHQAEGR
ncbi:hypothetical protein [Hymenobacter cellulosilyticus]|uniref:Uncharacterized protein n=1 Tax=Hymenobacter cellulosilyticus TaxID=2932248 RepID=A0A8T9Q454_9BACT|nr:hypothetical protein [Hymenobacter cellulosilyticus]UOQ71835.1 hypothetical protein MUN79_25070 [Hymenobacter cellulosilyticus]